MVAAQQPEPQPPWIAYPGNDPTWGGWRQGDSEAWLLQQFLPFWRGLNADQRGAYLERWPPPDEDWRTYLTVYWAGTV
jgi:hypothetical protein